MKNNKTGFTKIPHGVLESLLVCGLNKRELNAVLLILRLSYGCQRTWARVIQADLDVVGIGDSHAKEILEGLLSKTVLVQNEKTKELKINETIIPSNPTKDVSLRLDKLSHLIGKNLPRKTSQNGNSSVTKTVSIKLPKQEASSYQNSNTDPLPKEEDSASENPSTGEPKDIIKEKIINTVKESNGNEKTSNKEKPKVNTDPLPGSTPKGFTTPNQIFDISRFSVEKGSAPAEPSDGRYPYEVDPLTFTPTNNLEAEALRAWKKLEPDRPQSFRPTYLRAVSWGLPEGLFGQFASEVAQDPNARKRGALFLHRVIKWKNEHDKQK